jgi:hypothetical protein
LSAGYISAGFFVFKAESDSAGGMTDYAEGVNNNSNRGEGPAGSKLENRWRCDGAFQQQTLQINFARVKKKFGDPIFDKPILISPIHNPSTQKTVIRMTLTQ